MYTRWLCTRGWYARDSFWTELRARLPLSRWRPVRTDDYMGDCMGDSRAVCKAMVEPFVELFAELFVELFVGLFVEPL